MSDKKISIVLTTYNRPDITIQSFLGVLNDDRISEVIICDDYSTPENYQILIDNVLLLRSPKVKLYRNPYNMGVYDNKREAMSHATNEYAIQFDSDNILGTEYIDAVYSHDWVPDLILAPCYARPTFDYRPYTGIYFTKNNIKEYLNRPLFDALLNTMNFFCHREKYLSTWKNMPGIIGADSIYFNFLFLESGGILLPLKGMEYEHRVHTGSHYKNNEAVSTPLCKQVKELITQLQ